MKKHVVPLLFFVAVLAAGLLLRKYTYIWQANLSLFVATPDYFERLFSEPFPVTRLCRNFVLQFFGIHPVGPIVVAVLLTLLLLLLTALLRRLALIAPLRRIFGGGSGLLTPLAACIILALYLGAALTHGARRTELHSKVLVSTRNHDWKTLIKVLTPERCASDRDLLPFALLAQQEEGRLNDVLFRYPVESVRDLDYRGSNLVEGFFFDSVLAECLQLPNEAIHSIFQLSTGLPFGTCFLSLHSLVRNNLAKGDYRLAEKYLRILARSPRYASSAKKLLEQLGSSLQEDALHLADGRLQDEPVSESAIAPMISKNPIMNLTATLGLGRGGRSAEDRMIAYQLLDRNPSFVQMMLPLLQARGGRLPRHCQEALKIAGGTALPDDSAFMRYMASRPAAENATEEETEEIAPN